MPKAQTYALAGISTYGDYAQSTAGAAIDSLVALISPDSTSTLRGFMDEMSPAAQVQFLAELAAMKTAVGAFNA